MHCLNFHRSILAKNGSAVDSAIAILLCTGLVNLQSMGLGGGFVMMVYTKKNQKASYLNARECAPLEAHLDMFNDKPPKSSQEGQSDKRSIIVLNLSYMEQFLKY